MYCGRDRCSKMSYFIPCKTTNGASHIVYLFFKEIVRIHGLPLTILSDRDVKFIGHFWRTLWKKLGTNLSFSSTYHPQIDGQTKVVNKFLGSLLKHLTKKYGDKWELVLPQEEFSFNDSVNSGTRKNPFQIIFGKNPRAILELMELPSNTLVSAHRDDFVESMKEIHDSVRLALEKSAKKYKKEKDKHRRYV